MLGEPPPTEYDWRFQVFGFPVRVHPYFWLIAAFLGVRSGSSTSFVIWVAVVFVSILVHELGHAFAMRYFGSSARIVLHGFGGLAIHDSGFTSWTGGRPSRRDPNSQILISLAGPAAGFALAGFVVVVLHVSHRFAGYFPLLGLRIPLGDVNGQPIDPYQAANLWMLIYQLMTVNIYWSILNLMPVYPLDGGQVARELLIANTNDGLRMSLQLSVATAVALAVFALIYRQSPFMALMFGYLGYQSYQQLSGPYGGHRW